MSDHTNGASRPGPGQDRPSGEAAAVQWHLGEVAAIVRHQSTPLSPELLRIVLRGVGELCPVLFERGQEIPAEPPYLFRDHPVVSEALAMWEQRVRVAMTEQHATARGGR